ncbi:MAG TPA: cbb3-type cytochrome c oxidase N-terminal domain-containing protein, partial [Rubrivivax sp.]|nr:cbb3-type cytochrome c oxidase N-terminal domain-containing protein [Rubrivivax sp.]
MADFTDGFWSLYIAVLTVLGVVGCGVLLWSQSVVKAEKGGDGTTGHLWDEDLTELNTPMPRWWMWLFYITLVFSAVYLVLYPGLGSYAGKLGWQSSGEYKDELKKADARYAPLFAGYRKKSVEQVAADPQARAIGERLFLTYCAQCHGSDARGSKGFPNLADKDWLHGGTPEAIKTTIMEGRTGQMPPMGVAVGTDQDIANVAHYVMNM